MNVEVALRDEERVFALWAVEDSIGELLAAATDVHEALGSSDIQVLLPSGAERLERIQREAGTLVQELIGLKREYEAQLCEM